MNRSGAALALATALGLSPVSASSATAAQPASGAAQPAASSPATAADEEVEPEAVEALRRMSAYLMTLKSFELKADTTIDIVTMAGQRIQLGGQTTYKVRAPNAFVIDVNTDLKDRTFYYDGKQFTVYAPQLGYYASAPAPATIRETLNAIHDKFGLVLPLEDVFRWNDPGSERAEKLTSGFLVGPATVDGVATDHYAFREGESDWEIWIERGAKPLPRKLVIIDRTDLAAPGYVARLSWVENPPLGNDVFAFKPGPKAMAIQLATKVP